MPATVVYIICSPRPQVGKTLLARLLTEFLLLKNGAVLAFDLNVREPSLLDYLPNVTETAEIDDTFGKMQLMDRIIVDDGVAKVIDLGFHVFDEFFKMSEEIGFLKEAARRSVRPIVLIVVDNEHIVRGELPEAFAMGRLLRVNALPVFLKTYMDRLTFSFTDYLRHEKDSSAELHQWIRRNYFSFRELELSLILQCS
jgi:hypothetical protein